MKKRENREQLIIATKLGALPNDEGEQSSSNVQGNSRDVILREVDFSLERLQINYIDILYLHIDDRTSDLRETMKTLAELKQEGKIRSYGASNFKTWRLEQARNICEEEGIPFFSAIQQKYSYLTPVSDYKIYGVDKYQFVNDELTDYIKHYNDITVVGYSILLTGQYSQDEIIEPEYDTKENREKLNNLKNITDNPNKWVLDWVKEQNMGSVALVTTSSINNLRENMGL